MNDAHARTEGGSGVDSKLKVVRPGQKIAFPFGLFSSVRGAPFCRLFGKLIAEGKSAVSDDVSWKRWPESADEPQISMP